MTMRWTMKSFIDRLATRLWDTSDSSKARIAVWVDEILADMSSELPLGHYKFKLKKLLPTQQEIINLCPEIPTAPSVALTSTSTSLDYNTTSASDYTYDSAKILFNSTTAYLGKELVTAETFRNTFLTSNGNADISIGTNTASLNGTPSPTVEDNYLKLAGGTQQYAQYNGDVLDFANTGTFRFDYTPQYSGDPGSDKYIFSTSSAVNGTNNLLRLSHGAAGLSIKLYTSSGGLITTANFAFNPTALQTYKIEMSFDTTNGEYRCYIDGSKVGATATSSPGTRSDNTGYLRVGADYATAITATIEAWVSNIQIFNTVQNTGASYTTAPPPVYATSSPSITLDTGFTVGELSAFSESASKPTGTEIKYILNVDAQNKYWDGSAWSNSDGTYAQANTAAEINTNAMALLTVSSTVLVVAFLNTTDDQATPTLTSVSLSDVGDGVTFSDYKVYVTYKIFDGECSSHVESQASVASGEVNADFDVQSLAVTSIPVFGGDTTVEPSVIYRSLYMAKKSSTDTDFGEPFFVANLEDNTTTTYTISSDPTSVLTPPDVSEIDQLSSEHPYLESGNKFLVRESSNKVRRADPNSSESTSPYSYDFIGETSILLYPQLSSGATDAQRTLSYWIYRRPHKTVYVSDLDIDAPKSWEKALFEGVVWKGYEYKDRNGVQTKLNNYELFKKQLQAKARRQRGKPTAVRDVNGDTYGWEV